ncbi:sulfatase [Halalkalibaculum sp. DA384]|uniref:sulfatase family protein n=1 Tax=Halalkalibaculum sp. DA384 TaxID=3373606 RepID=UPI00375528EB
MKIYLAGILLLLMSCNSNQEYNNEATDSAREKPNIIFIMADDLGYGDLSSYGSPSVETPNIDALADEGMKFMRFYAASAVCTPSRASVLTGKYPLRFDITRHFMVANRHLPDGTPTIPSVLKKAGYGTAHLGKWHLGGLRTEDVERRQEGKRAVPGPLQHGFDHYLSQNEGEPPRLTLIRERQMYRKGGHHMFRNDKQAPKDDNHWTEIKINEASRLIADWDEKNQPFYLNLWFTVPHTPYEPAPEPHLSKYEKIGATGDQLLFRSMMSHMDAQIGRLVDTLKARNLYENTLIVFTSDNGPAYQGSPGPFRGGKTDLHEGGIRVPMIAVWKGHVPENTTSFQTMHMVDLLPTFAEAAGVDHGIEDLDGMSLLDHLMGGPRQERGVLTWQMDLYNHFQNQGPKPEPYATSVAIKGKWKLLADSLQPTELFNLEQDHRELYNLLGQHPEIEQELLEALKEFHAAPRNRWPDIEY